MQDNCIAVSLELPELQILQQKELNNHFEVTVMYRHNTVICPRCGQKTGKVHDSRYQIKQDCQLRDKAVWLILVKRRFRCKWCKKVFTEPDPVFGIRRRSSMRFRKYLGQEALHQTIRRLARKEQVSEGLVRRSVVEEINRNLDMQNQATAPELIGLDEFAVKKGHIYNTAICNLSERTVMEVVEGRGRQRVENYFNKLANPDNVKGVAMDMHEPFRQAVQLCLPQAKIVVDKFHVIKLVNGVVDAVRNRIQRTYSGNRKYLFRSRYLLLKGVERLSSRERERLKMLFFYYPELKQAWVLKERLRALYQLTSRRRAEEILTRIKEDVTACSLIEYKRFLSTLDNWGSEILNYFDYRITNGFVEGKNNRIKTIKRMGYGYRNTNNFRLRILAANTRD